MKRKGNKLIVNSHLTQFKEPPQTEPRGAINGTQTAEAMIFDASVLTDLGNERDNNEDSVGLSVEGGTSLVMVVADGVGGYEGGEQASRMAVDVALESYRQQDTTIAPEKRLYRAAQQANIEIYDRAIVVPELRNMSTTLTAVAVEGSMLYAAHVGDSRLYLLRAGAITQVTKDHTVAAERVRQRLLTPERARHHPDHGTLTRSLGRELIAAVDRITLPVQTGDVLVVCTDGLHNILYDEEIAKLAAEGPADMAARRLIDAANEKGTFDNLSAAVCRIVGELPTHVQLTSWRKRLRAWLRSAS